MQKVKKVSGQSRDKSAETPAPMFEQRERVYQRLMEVLEEKDMFAGVKSKAKKEYARQLWQRLSPDQKEIDFLMGLIKKAGA